MLNKKFKYQPLETEQLQIQWDKHKRIIENFIISNGFNIDSIFVNESAVMSIIAKVHQRKKYFEYFHRLNMSECKEVALICFWYIKLRPICAISKQENAEIFNSINEKLCVYYIIVSLEGMLKKKKLPIQKL